jgi:hypothetical protein
MFATGLILQFLNVTSTKGRPTGTELYHADRPKDRQEEADFFFSTLHKLLRIRVDAVNMSFFYVEIGLKNGERAGR